jgi:hypothetical protein
VIYAGRFARELAPTGAVSEGCEILSEWGVLPRDLAAALKRATTLVVLDPLSFPFETMEGEGWTVPLVVAPPEGFDPDALTALFGPGLFGRLGPFDRVATADDALWEGLRARHDLFEGQRLRVGGSVEESAAELCALLLNETEAPNVLRDPYEEERFWAERGGPTSVALGARSALHRRLGFDKAVHRAQAGALEPQLAGARAASAPDVPLDFLEVGCGSGRWAWGVLSGLPGARYTGAEGDGALLASAREGFPNERFPGARFDRLEGAGRLPYGDEGFDVVFGASAMRYLSAEEKAALISEMWRVAKPGGRIVLLEEFVAEERPAGVPAPSTVSISSFVNLVASATAGGVSLEHVETLRYPHDTLTKSAVISLAKLGAPRTW